MIDERISNESFIARFQSNISLTAENRFGGDDVIDEHRWNESFIGRFQSNILSRPEELLRVSYMIDGQRRNEISNKEPIPICASLKSKFIESVIKNKYCSKNE